jgi:hypothetical protein
LSLAHTSKGRFLHCGTTKCAVPPVGGTNTENLGIARRVGKKSVTMHRAPTGNAFGAMRLVVAIEERFLVAALLETMSKTEI